MQKIIILKIGGSLLSRSEEKLFDFDYFFKLKNSLQLLSDEGYRFMINVGGGYITRKYQKLTAEHGETDIDDVHRVGVALTNLNAQIFHGLLGDLAHPDILRYKEYDEFLATPHPDFDFLDSRILVASGSKPGKSNDWNALQFAINLGTDLIIDVKNVDGVYTANPSTDPTATRLDALTWSQYLGIIGNPTEHKPGANYPVDPLAANESKARGIKFMIIGEDTTNLERAVRGESYVGTMIQG